MLIYWLISLQTVDSLCPLIDMVSTKVTVVLLLNVLLKKLLTLLHELPSWCELDKVTSVSSNIMLGQEVPIGTGAVDVMFDEEKYFENIQSVHEELVQEEEEETNEEQEFKEAYCNNLF